MRWMLQAAALICRRWFLLSKVFRILGLIPSLANCLPRGLPYEVTVQGTWAALIDFAQENGYAHYIGIPFIWLPSKTVMT